MTYEFPRHYQLTPDEEISQRLISLTETLSGQVDAAIFSWPADLIYLTGSNQAGHLLVAPGLDPVYLVRRSSERARQETAVSVKAVDSLSHMTGIIIDYLGRSPRRLGLTGDVMPYREATGLTKKLGQPEIVEVSSHILKLRSVKSDWEIGVMEAAGDLNRDMLAAVGGMFKPGMSESEWAGLMMAWSMAHGGQALSRMRKVTSEIYPWHVVAGDRTLIPSRVEAPFGGLGMSPSLPLGASMEPIRKGDMALVDFNNCLSGYHVDVTRMFSVGPPPKRGLEAYQALKTIQADLMQAVIPGADGSQIYDRTVALAKKLGWGEEFLGQGRSAIKFVAHGIGLDISEPPYVAKGRTEIIQLNQTLALELKMVLPGIGAVGLENTVAVTATGCRLLTTADQSFVQLEG